MKLPALSPGSSLCTLCILTLTSTVQCSPRTSPNYTIGGFINGPLQLCDECGARYWPLLVLHYWVHTCNTKTTIM